MNNGSKGGNNRSKIALSVVLVVILCLGSFGLGSLVTLVGVNTSKYSSVFKGNDNVDEYKEIFAVRDMLLSKYDGEIDDKTLVEGALKGMTASLKDPYTVYMNEDEYTKFMEDNQGEFVGIGVQIGAKDGMVAVIAPIENSPAEKAGIKQGDIILKVEDMDVTADNMDKAVSMMKGTEGEAVNITIQRGKDIKEVTIVRSKIEIISVKGEMIDDKIGYIEIVSFDEKVSTEFKNQLTKLKKSGMEGLILDLRGNPGGYLEECVKIASQFIEKNKVVTYTIDKYEKRVDSKSLGGDAIGMPLTILVDGGSASASEVVTGALRDYGVATIVGETTFGKGVVQQVFPMEGSGLKITTSKYYTPNGENIHGKGIKPDIEVKYPDELREKEYNRANDPQFKKALDVINDKIK